MAKKIILFLFSFIFTFVSATPPLLAQTQQTNTSSKKYVISVLKPLDFDANDELIIQILNSPISKKSTGKFGNQFGNQTDIDPFPPEPDIGNGSLPPHDDGTVIITGDEEETPMPEEYSCNVIDDKTYEALFQAVDSLKSSLQQVREMNCPSPGGYGNNEPDSVGSILSNLETMKTSISSVIPHLTGKTDLDINSSSVSEIEQNIVGALSSASAVGESLKKNKKISECAKLNSADPSVVWSVVRTFNDVTSNLVPFALLAVSLSTGGIGGAAAGGAGAVASKVGALIAKYPIFKSILVGGLFLNVAGSWYDSWKGRNATLQMTDHEQRKAVFQHVCEYTKIKKKLDYLSLSQAGKLISEDNNLLSGKKNERRALAPVPADLKEAIKYKLDWDKKIKNLENKINPQWQAFQALFSATEDTLLCQNALAFVQQEANSEKNFSKKIFEGLTWLDNSLKTFNTKLIPSNVSTLKNAFNINLNALNALRAEGSAALKSSTKVSDCAKVGKALVTSISTNVKLLSSKMVDLKNLVHDKLKAEIPEYMPWYVSYHKKKIEKQNTERLELALDALKKSSPTLRYELNQRMRELKDALFYGTEAPAHQWLSYLRKTGEEQDYEKYKEYLRILQQLSATNYLKSNSHTQAILRIGNNLQHFLDSSYHGRCEIDQASSSSTRKKYVLVSPNSPIKNITDWATAHPSSTVFVPARAGVPSLTVNEASKLLTAAGRLSNFVLWELNTDSLVGGISFNTKEHSTVCQYLGASVRQWNTIVDTFHSAQLFCTMVNQVLDQTDWNSAKDLMRLCASNEELQRISRKSDSKSIINELLDKLTAAPLLNLSCMTHQAYYSQVVKERFVHLKCPGSLEEEAEQALPGSLRLRGSTQDKPAERTAGADKK